MKMIAYNHLICHYLLNVPKIYITKTAFSCKGGQKYFKRIQPHRHDKDIYHSFDLRHPCNKSFTNNIQPTQPTPAKKTNPIKIITLLGLDARRGTVAG